MNKKRRDDEKRLMSAALQNAQSILQARLKAERELLQAKEELERKNEELRQQREWFEVTLGSIGDAVITTDTRGRVTFMNGVAEAMTGWEKAKALGLDLQNVLRLKDERTGRPVLNPVQEVLQEGKVVALASYSVLLARDGREIAIEDSAAPIRDGSGSILGVVLVFHDATEKRRAARVLKEESLALEVLNRTGATIAAHLDLETAVQTVTDAATELSGAQFGAFFYNSIDEQGNAYMLYTLCGAKREQFAGFGQPRATPMFGPTFRGEGIIRIDDVREDPRYGQWGPHHGMPPGHLPVRSYLAVPVVSHSGEVIGGLFFGHSEPGVFTPRAERIVGGIAAFAAIAIDNARLYEAAQREIANREKAEQALRAADRRKDEFLATLAHELRNPLAPIRQAAGIWKTGRMSAEELAWSHEVVERQSRHMGLLLEDLLDISRITRGKLSLRKEWGTLDEIVEAAVETARPLIEERGHELRVELPSPPLRLYVDPLRVAQVLANLLTNAAKYTPPGGRVAVGAATREGECSVWVSDTGIGISPELLPGIFEMFSQTVSAIDRVEEGLGIGLALVKGLVEMHGGRLDASSPGPGRGSRFSIHLPYAPAPEAPAPSSPPAIEIPGARGVLIADDNRDMADSLALFLRLLGHRVAVVYDGEEALAAFSAERPEVVVLDIGMPGMNGYETAKKLRKQEGGRGITLVALTGWGQEEDRNKAFAAGFDHHFTKPIDPKQLAQLIQKSREQDKEK